MDAVRRDENDIHHEINAESSPQHHERFELARCPIVREEKPGHAEKCDHEPIEDNEAKSGQGVPHPDRDKNSRRTQRRTNHEPGHCFEGIRPIRGKHPKGDIAGPHEEENEEDQGAGKARVVT